MAIGDPWTRHNFGACIADDLRMVTLQLNGTRCSKTERVHALLKLLHCRSRGAIVFNPCNITNVLLDLDYPTMNGSKRCANDHRLLFDVADCFLPWMLGKREHGAVFRFNREPHERCGIATIA